MTGEASNQKAEIERMLKEIYREQKWVSGLKKLTSFTGKDGKEVSGVENINKLSEKRVQVTYGKIKPEYEKWVKENGRKPDTEQTAGGGEFEDSQLSV